MHKTRKTITLSGGTTGAEDWGSTEVVVGGPSRIFRIDIDDALVTAAAPGEQFEDELGIALAATDPKTLLWTADDNAVQYEGIVVGAVVAAVDSCAETDALIVTIWWE